MKLCTVGTHSHNRINCPFHGWAFDLAGKLAGLPGEEYFLDFDKDQVGLQPVHIGEWSDLIFVNFAEEPSKTLEQFLGELVDDFRGYFSPEQWQPVRRYHWTLVRKSVGSGKGVSGRVDPGGRGSIKNKKKKINYKN